MKAFHLLLVLAAATFVSCERHEFEETRVLSEPHDGAHSGYASGKHAASSEHAEGDKEQHPPHTEH
jgi:hypothetical protein